MSYTDSQMVIAAQIAYMDWDADAVNSGLTVREYLELAKSSGDPKLRDQAASLLRRIEETPGAQSCADWVIKDVRNNNNTTGMYACMIETGDGEALIAFRGSETDSIDDYILDWGASDAGLLNSVLTPQQASAQAYMEYIYEKYGDEYDRFSVTGHSLGGNLAEHATITAPDGMKDKIIQCVNLDGPGFSNQYLIAHASDIEKIKDVIQHYQWSIVGSLLTPIPGTDYQTIDADTPDKDNEIEALFWRHNLPNVNFDENGNVIPGERDPLAAGAGPVSQILDMSIFMLFPAMVFPSMIYNIIDTFHDTLHNIWEWWQDFRYQRNRSMQAEVHCDTVRGSAEELAGTAPELAAVRDEIARIRRELAFQSLSASYISIRLWNIENKIGNDISKTRKYSEKGMECMRCYEQSENKIVTSYGH